VRARWETKQLGDIAYLAGRIGWKGLTAKEYTNDGPFFLSVHSLNYGDFIDFRDAFHISQERYDESPEIMLQRDDILICKDGAGIGKLGIVGELPGPSTVNSSLLVIRALESLLPKFLYHFLCSPSFQKIVQERIAGATTPHLYQREIRRFRIPAPLLSEQERIVAIIDEAFGGLHRCGRRRCDRRSRLASHRPSPFSGRRGAPRQRHAQELEQGYR
jgi:type I restriction enzyme S subunit